MIAINLGIWTWNIGLCVSAHWIGKILLNTRHQRGHWTFIRPALAIRYCNVNLHALCVYSLYDSVVYSFFFMRFEKTWLFSACSSHTWRIGDEFLLYSCAVNRNEKRDILDYHFTVIWNSYIWSYPSILDVIDSTWYTYICLLVI